VEAEVVADGLEGLAVDEVGIADTPVAL